LVKRILGTCFHFLFCLKYLTNGLTAEQEALAMPKNV
jgi:hypothetical protein